MESEKQSKARELALLRNQLEAAELGARSPLLVLRAGVEQRIASLKAQIAKAEAR